MGFLNFGKRIKNRSFDYIPRHYDPQKEELEERLKRYQTDASSPELTKERIRGSFRRNYRVKDEYTSRTQKRSNRILLGTLLILLLISYIFLTEYLPQIVASFE